MNLAVVDGLEIVHVEGDPDALTALRLGLDLDADVNERLVSWQLPDGEDVTLRRLLGHTAGFGMPFGEGPGRRLPLFGRRLRARTAARRGRDW